VPIVVKKNHSIKTTIRSLRVLRVVSHIIVMFVMLPRKETDE